MCILSEYTLIIDSGYYDLSVLSMSVMGFQKKIGWGELYPICLDFWIFFNMAKPLGESACVFIL